MNSILSHVSRRGFRGFEGYSRTSVSLRHVSTEALQSSLQTKLTSRTPNIIYDYLSPTPSHLLNISLADFLPESCYPPGFSTGDLTLPRVPTGGSGSNPNALPQGHHLIYFSPQVPSSKLLPDGTDPLQSPGEPFVRRMWAGGTLTFDNFLRDQPELDNQRAYCREHIPNVIVKGSEGNEKVFVNIERQIGNASEIPAQDELSNIESQRHSSPSIIEMRNIVFMREKSVAAVKEDVARPGKTVRPPHAADFSLALVPTSSLLFRFSALTFNAHSIHLNPQYCREVEGYRNLLVHGPLTLVLMLSVLRSQLKAGEKVKTFDYKNLAPVYADEQLKVCVRQDRAKENKYEVWIEGREGGYAVKGSAIAEQAHAAAS